MSNKTIAEFEQETIEVLNELTQDWDTGFAEAITASTAIVADLGLESLDVVHMIAAIEQRYQKFDLPFEELLLVDGHYIEDLTVSQIAQFVHRHLNNGGGGGR